MGIFKKGAKHAGVAEEYLARRAAILDLGEAPDPPPTEEPEVLGVVIDVPQGAAFATFIALADGTTTLYLSGGGVEIGGGKRAAVAQANRALLAAVRSSLVLFPADRDRSLPPVEFVRFTVLTTHGRCIAHIPEPAFWGHEPSPVAELVGAAQTLISRLRETSPGS